jgi:hypothetical protein
MSAFVLKDGAVYRGRTLGIKGDHEAHIQGKHVQELIGKFNGILAKPPTGIAAPAAAINLTTSRRSKLSRVIVASPCFGAAMIAHFDRGCRQP